MIWLLALLILSGEVWAQPVEGPWPIWVSDNAITSPEVCVRGTVADILWIENDSVRHAQWLLDYHELEGPTTVLPLPGWHTQELHDLIQVNDSTWACLVYVDQRPYQPGDSNSMHNRTVLLFGGDMWTASYALDSSVTSEYFPVPGEYWNYGFSVTPRVGGGIATGWVKCIFWQFDPDMCSHFRSFQPDFTEDYQAEDFVGIGYILDRNRVLARSVTADSFLVVSATMPLCSAISTGEWGYYSSCYWQTNCQFMSAIDFGLTHSGAIRVLACAQDWECNPEALSIEITGEYSSACSELSQLDLPAESSKTSWHPNYGFAISHVSPNSLQLARVDTNGVQTLPTGTLFWRDSLHTFGEANLTITDAGEVVVIWTERQDGDTAARRVMLGSVGWDTPLSTKLQPEVVGSPREFALSAYPNPFNGETRITYDLPRRAKVELSVHNLLGEEVARLRSGIEEAGVHTVQWKPQVSSGIYFARLATPASTLIKKSYIYGS